MKNFKKKIQTFCHNSNSLEIFVLQQAIHTLNDSILYSDGWMDEIYSFIQIEFSFVAFFFGLLLLMMVTDLKMSLTNLWFLSVRLILIHLLIQSWWCSTFGHPFIYLFFVFNFESQIQFSTYLETRFIFGSNFRGKNFSIQRIDIAKGQTQKTHKE